MNRFGFGAMRLPLINPDDKQSIDMDELKRMVDIYIWKQDLHILILHFRITTRCQKQR